jgi:hypothetical protein
VEVNEQEIREVIERMDTKLRAAQSEKDGAQRAKLIARVVELRHEVAQIFVDTAFWNDNVRKPHEALIDPDPDGLLRLLLGKLDAQIKAWVQ